MNIASYDYRVFYLFGAKPWTIDYYCLTAASEEEFPVLGSLSNDGGEMPIVTFIP